MITGKWIPEEGDLTEVNRIRAEVFADSPALVAHGARPDAFCMYALVCTEKGDPAAAGAALFDGTTYSIAGLGVRKAERGNGYGDFLLRMLLDRAGASLAQKVFCDAPSGTEGFFSRLDFVPCGEVFEADGVTWVPLQCSMSVPADCCSCLPAADQAVHCPD